MLAGSRRIMNTTSASCSSLLGRAVAAAASVRLLSMSAPTAAAAKIAPYSSNKCFGGHQNRYKHVAETLGGCEMSFAAYIPENPQEGEKFPVLYWLSGLTCDDTNFIMKAGAQKYLNDHRIMLVCPDTSPRGLDLPNEHDAYDFGSGAGFYLKATTDGYKDHYHMFDYVTSELPSYVESNLPADSSRRSIFGHSMGGLGALNLFLKTANFYKSVSAFSPIANPTNCPWGEKAFKGYLGTDRDTWKEWDPSLLLKDTDLDALAHPILISQGMSDDFLENELKPESFPQHPNIILNKHDGYDHSYYFIATFVEEHIKHHAAALAKT